MLLNLQPRFMTGYYCLNLIICTPLISLPIIYNRAMGIHVYCDILFLRSEVITVHYKSFIFGIKGIKFGDLQLL